MDITALDVTLRCSFDSGGPEPAYVDIFSHCSFTDRFAQREVLRRTDIDGGFWARLTQAARVVVQNT